MKLLKLHSKGIEQLYNRNLYYRRKSTIEKVQRMIEDVRVNGDEAVLKYTRRFDKVKLLAKDLRVSESEISGAFQNISPEFISTLKFVINNVSMFYKKQIKKPACIKSDEGIHLKEEYKPIDTVGVYIPAGTAPLVSSVYMTVIPAQIAGVRRIIIVTPPGKDGRVNPHILAVANLLNVKEVYKIGGAQAIAAMAFGTKIVPKVDKVVGPGNSYVTEAKRQIFGYADIDMLAGPTELVVIANRYSNPDFVVADFESQLEHAGGLSILISTSKQLIRQVRNRVQGGFVIYAKNMEEACEITNKIAPEHLQILTNNPQSVARMIKNAGAIFLGAYSPTPLGDYIAGPSHVLPTLGTARFSSGLSLNDFLKTSHIISYSKKALEKVRESLERVALIEGLVKHAESVNVRFK
ncbi:MAG: histidinol dehydrogenase [Candidatus Omnitrophica bacterium]|nr:histidinol dehydrogenase [Candidatus Omnitrophota bacterium]